MSKIEMPKYLQEKMDDAAYLYLPPTHIHCDCFACRKLAVDYEKATISGYQQAYADIRTELDIWVEKIKAITISIENKHRIDDVDCETRKLLILHQSYLAEQAIKHLKERILSGN